MNGPYPQGLAVGMQAAFPTANEPLWLPPRLRERARSHRTEIEAVGHGAKKLVYFKGRLFVPGSGTPPSHIDTNWYGGIRRVPYNLDLDEPGNDGLTLRYQIKLYVTGLLERVSGGEFVHQDSDERDDTTLYDEVPELGHSRRTWAAFWRRDR